MKQFIAKQKKSTLLIALPFIALFGWIVFYLILIATNVISSVPTLDAELMSPAQIAEYQAAQQTSDLWNNIWFGGFVIIVIVGLISFIKGLLSLRRTPRA